MRHAGVIGLLILLVALSNRLSFAESYLELVDGSGTVVVDGDTLRAGTVILPMHSGRHRLTYLPVQDEIIWKPPLKSLLFNLAEGETLKVDLGRTISVRIESHPPGCEIYRGGIFIGNTPVLLPTIAGYPDTLTLEKEGYLTIRISPELLGEGDTYRVELLPEDKNDVRLGHLEAGKKNGKARLMKYGSFAASIASISLGFWYKNRADSYYDDYLTHGNPETMERMYIKSLQLDDRARVFWIIGEAAALLASYLFVREYIFPQEKTKQTSDWCSDNGNTR